MDACKANPLPGSHLGHIINAYDLQQVLKAPMIVAHQRGFSIVKYGQRGPRGGPTATGGEREQFASFADAVAGSGIAEWVTPKGGGAYVTGTWFPAAYKERIESLPFGDSHKKVKCVVSGPGQSACGEYTYREWSGSTCGKPSVGEVEFTEGFGTETRTVTRPLCGLHMAAHNRRVANAVAREAHFEELRKEAAEQKAMDQASEDWARRLAEEFGLTTKGSRTDGEKLWVKVAPEELYAKLVDLYGLARDVGIDPAEIGVA
jgi:hypothetical protein